MSIGQDHGTSRHRPGRALLIVVLGASLAGVTGVATCRSQQPDDFGAPAVTSLASSSPAPVAVRVPIQDGRSRSPVAVEAPARLRIRALDLDTVVEAVGIDPATGDFAVPRNVDRVGWYRYGPGLAATAGSIVVAGHVDSAVAGPGAFFRLASLVAGDVVTLTGAGGRTREFEVVARERYSKAEIPLSKYFARDGAVRLTLITCGGPFDAETRSYRDNVLVTAVPR